MKEALDSYLPSNQFQALRLLIDWQLLIPHLITEEIAFNHIL